MRVSDRALLITTALLLGAAVALCWYTSTTLESFPVTDNVPPWPVALAQTMSWIADILALVGLASAAGLLFLRAARWARTPAGDEEPTREP